MSPSSSRLGHWQFSLYGLLVLMFVAAVAAARVSVVEAKWSEHVLAVIALAFAIGLVHEARDLWSAHRRQTWPSPEHRDGWVFAVGWRVGLSLGLLSLLAVDNLEAYRIINLPEPDDTFYKTGRMTREALLRLSLLTALLGAGKQRIAARAGYRDLLGWLALLVIAFLIMLNETTLPLLVHLALRGIEAARAWVPLGTRLNPQAYLDLTAATDVFFLRAAGAAVLLPINLALSAALARQWRRGAVRRLLVAAPLAAGLAASAAFIVWASTRGFASISPGLAPFLIVEPAYRWVLFGMLAGLASNAAAARFCYGASGWLPLARLPQASGRAEARPPDRSSGGEQLSGAVMAGDSHKYLHQRTASVLALAAVCAVQIIQVMLEIKQMSSWLDLQMVLYVCYSVLTSSTMALNWGILLAAACILLARRRQPADGAAVGLWALSLPAWAAVSSALWLTMITGLPALYWFCFALWLQAGRS